MRTRDHAKRRVHQASVRSQLADVRRSAVECEQEMGSLASYLHATAEDEKRSLARALHDELGGALTVAKMHLHVLKDQAASSAAMAERVDRLAKALDEAVSVERRAVESLRPSVLDHLGLAAAINHHMTTACGRAKLACRCDALADADAIPREQAIVVYRLIQEGLANIIDAHRAEHIEISLRRDDAGFRLCLSEDADHGAAALPPLHHQRLSSMRQRAQALGGTLDVRAALGRTHVNVFFPSRQ